VEDGAQRVQDKGHFFRKGLDHIDGVASRMRNARGGQRGMIARPVARRGIGHVDRRIGHFPQIEHFGKVLAGMTGPGLEQGDQTIGRLGDDPGSEHAGAIGGRACRQRFGARLLRQVQDAHRRIIVVHHGSLGCLPCQFVEDRA
jgi:hypothetical protein